MAFAERVNVLLPLPGAGMLALEKRAVTPLGTPLTERLIDEWNPVPARVDRGKLAEPPRAVLAEEELEDNANVPKTIRLRGWLLLRLPPVPDRVSG